MARFLLFLALALLSTRFTNGQVTEPVYNYDEAKVGAYTLPNALINSKGKVVKT